MQFKKGDKVRVRKDLRKGNGVNDEMMILAGKTVTISRIKSCGHYAIKEDSHSWCWTDEMFEAPAKFKVGDIVVAKDNEEYDITTNGWAGKVIKIYDDGMIRVAELNREKFNFAVDPEYFELASEHKRIVITTDGKTTTAKLIMGNKTVKMAKAKCSPDDEFNFEIGVNLAFDRLMHHSFKVGDIVAAHENAPYGTTKNGWKGKVIDFNRSTDQIKVRGIKNFKQIYWVSSKYFTLATAAEDAKPEFEVGEFVKVVANRDIYHYFPIGELVQIKMITANTLVCYGLIKNGDYYFGEQRISIEDVEKL